MNTAVYELDTTISPDVFGSLDTEQKQKVREILSVDHVDLLRDYIYTKRQNDREQVFNENSHEMLDVIVDLLAEVDRSAVSDGIEQHLRAHEYDENDPTTTVLSSVLERYSPIIMDEGYWQQGNPDTDGNYDASQSGKAQLANEALRLLGDPDVDPGTVAEWDRLQTELETSRQAVAKLSVKQRGMVRKGSKKAEALQTHYASELAAYNTAKTAIGVAAIEQLRAEGVSEDEIAQAVKSGIINEQMAFTAQEAQALTTDSSRRAKFYRFYSKMPAMLAINSIGGAAAGIGFRKITKWGFVAAVPVAGVAGLMAFRAGKSLLTASVAGHARLHKEVDKRAASDLRSLEAQLNSGTGIPIGNDIEASEYANLFSNVTTDAVNERINKDIRANKVRVAASMFMAGSAAVVGALAAEHLPDLHLFNRSGSGTSNSDLPSLRSGVTPPAEVNPDIARAREIIAQDPEGFERFIESAEQIKESTGLEGSALDKRVADTLALAEHLENSRGAGVGTEVLTTGTEAVSIPHGGGIITDIIRPFAGNNGVSLSPSQETQIWQSMRLRFGDNIFTDNSLLVGGHGADQWILKPGNGVLRPEVAEFLRQQITIAQQ